MKEVNRTIWNQPWFINQWTEWQLGTVVAEMTYATIQKPVELNPKLNEYKNQMGQVINETR